MKNLTFADIYSGAQFTLAPTTMELRQKSAERFLKSVGYADLLGLVRSHFGLSSESFLDRLIGAFRQDDASISFANGDREAMILSTGLIAALISMNNIAATHALVTAQFAGQRIAPVRPDLAEWARSKLHDASVGLRNQDIAAATKLARVAKGKTGPAIDAWVPTNDPAKLGAVLKQMVQETDAAASNFFENSSQATRVLSREIDLLREELGMLWWNVGGFSKQKEKAFAELPKKAVPIFSGVELADLTRTQIGPAAVGALVQLRINASAVAETYSIADCVNAAAAEGIIFPDPTELSDICPILAGLKLKVHSGGGDWQKIFKETTGLDAAAKMASRDVAMQVYREILLVRDWTAEQ